MSETEVEAEADADGGGGGGMEVGGGAIVTSPEEDEGGGAPGLRSARGPVGTFSKPSRCLSLAPAPRSLRPERSPRRSRSLSRSGYLSWSNIQKSTE